MNKPCTALFLSICLGQLATIDLVAQGEISKTVRANNIITRFSQLNQRLTVGDVIVGMQSNDAHEIIGDTYWDKHWGKSSLLLYKNDELVEGYVIRYDIYKNEFEFLIQKDVRVLQGTRVKNIVWIDSISNQTRYMVNAKDYLENDVPLIGFFEVLVEGEITLLKKIRLEILKPDFNPALNVGSKDTRIVKKQTFYYSTDNHLTKIKSKKSLESISKENAKQMEVFIKKEGIKFTEERDLVKLFTFLESL